MDKAFRVAVILSAQDEMTRKINSVMDATDRRMQQTAWNAQRMGRDMMGAGVAIGAGLALPIKNAIDFEQQMSKVGAISRANETDLARLTEEAKRLGAITDRTAKEAAQGLEFLSMAGFNAEQQLQSLEGVIQLSGAAAVDMGTAADITTNILGAFRMEASQITRVNDAMVNTFTRSNVNLVETAEAMKMAAPIAAGLGAEIEELSAMVGLLGNVGIKGTMAGTSLRAAYQRLAAPVGAAEAALKSMNVQVADEDGNMRSMTDILVDMADATQNMGNVARQANIKEIFGERAAGAISELLAQASGDDILKFTQQIEESGAAARVYEQMLDNTAGGIKEAMSAAEALSITLGNTLLPGMRDYLTMGTGILRATNNWAIENESIAAGILKLAGYLSGFLTVSGATVFAFGKVLDLMRLGIKPIAGVFKAFMFLGSGMAHGMAVMLRTGSVMKGLIAITRALNLALLANPYALVAYGIITAAILIWKYWEPIKAFFSGLWSDLQASFEAGWVDGILKVIEMFHPLVWVAKGMNALTEWLFDFSLFDAGANMVKTIWQGIKSYAYMPVQAMKEIVGKIRDFLPFSPAKVGPLRDIHRVNIIEQVAQSMKPAPMVEAMQAATRGTMQAATRQPSTGSARRLPVPIGSTGRGMVINYSPELNINGPVGEAERQSFSEQLRRHKDELQRMLEQIHSDKTRRAY